MLKRDDALRIHRAIETDADFAALVRTRLQDDPSVTDGRTYAIALGKLALPMAQGLGPVARGICVSTRASTLLHPLPTGWTGIDLPARATPEQLRAGREALIDLVATSSTTDLVFCLISDGATELVGVELAAGKLARMIDGPMRTFTICDATIHSLADLSGGPSIPARPGDRVENVNSRRAANTPVGNALDALGLDYSELGNLDADVDEALGELISAMAETPAEACFGFALFSDRFQLALLLARELRHTMRAALVIGTDGGDGAYVDPHTWDRILAARLDPELAVTDHNARAVLAAVGAIEVADSTGINHGDLVLIG